MCGEMEKRSEDSGDMNVSGNHNLNTSPVIGLPSQGFQSNHTYRRAVFHNIYENRGRRPDAEAGARTRHKYYRYGEGRIMREGQFFQMNWTTVANNGRGSQFV